MAAVRAPATLPLPALLQIPSTLAFTLDDSVPALAMIDLQIATYCAATAAPAAPGGMDGVDVDVGVGVLVPEVAGVGVVAGALVPVDPLVVELLLLPHAAINAPQSSASTRSTRRLASNGPPL